MQTQPVSAYRFEDYRAVIALEGPDCRLHVRELYDRVVFGAVEDDAAPE
jgi:hypothetical protein